MLKLIILPRSREGMSGSELQAYLEHVHGPLVMRHAGVSGVFRRYVHHYTVEGAPDPVLGWPVLTGRDAVTIIGFDDMAGFQSSIASPGYRQEVGPDEANFSEREGSLFFFVEEFILRAAEEPATIKLFHLRRFVPGLNPADASTTWRERVSEALGATDARWARSYSHDLVTSPEPVYDAIDEIELGALKPDDAAALADGLGRAEEGLFEPSATAAVVTRAKVFI